MAQCKEMVCIGFLFNKLKSIIIIYFLIDFIIKCISLSGHPIVPSFLRSCEN